MIMAQSLVFLPMTKVTSLHFTRTSYGLPIPLKAHPSMVYRAIIHDDALDLRIGLRKGTLNGFPKEARLVVAGDHNKYQQVIRLEMF
jgi:hypothetical protein